MAYCMSAATTTTTVALTDHGEPSVPTIGRSTDLDRLEQVALNYALHKACDSWHLEAVRTALDAKADVTSVDVDLRYHEQLPPRSRGTTVLDSWRIAPVLPLVRVLCAMDDVGSSGGVALTSQPSGDLAVCQLIDVLCGRYGASADTMVPRRDYLGSHCSYVSNGRRWQWQVLPAFRWAVRHGSSALITSLAKHGADLALTQDDCDETEHGYALGQLVGRLSAVLGQTIGPAFPAGLVQVVVTFLIGPVTALPWIRLVDIAS